MAFKRGQEKSLRVLRAVTHISRYRLTPVELEPFLCMGMIHGTELNGTEQRNHAMGGAAWQPVGQNESNNCLQVTPLAIPLVEVVSLPQEPVY